MVSFGFVGGIWIRMIATREEYRISLVLVDAVLTLQADSVIVENRSQDLLNVDRNVEERRIEDLLL